jgi:hypothetical protein
VRALAPGYVSTVKEVDLPPGERPREVTVRDLMLELERGGVVLGQVRDDDGQPVVGARVTVGPLRARSDGRGEFRLDGVAAGRVRVEAEEGGRRASDEVEVRADDESHVELRLK